MESAREADAGDLAELVRLATRARADVLEQRGGALWALRESRPDSSEEAFHRALQASDRLVVVGLFDDVPVGYGVVREEVLRDGSRLGVVDDLYVEPDAREVGVGEAMMSLLVGWCDARGCSGLDALALPGDRASKNFFETHGLVARAIVVHRAFDASRAGGSNRAKITRP
jgi:GNAT superfamily N-acetyltransferase